MVAGALSLQLRKASGIVDPMILWYAFSERFANRPYDSAWRLRKTHRDV